MTVITHPVPVPRPADVETVITLTGDDVFSFPRLPALMVHSLTIHSDRRITVQGVTSGRVTDPAHAGPGEFLDLTGSRYDIPGDEYLSLPTREQTRLFPNPAVRAHLINALVPHPGTQKNPAGRPRPRPVSEPIVPAGETNVITLAAYRSRRSS